MDRLSAYTDSQLQNLQTLAYTKLISCLYDTNNSLVDATKFYAERFGPRDLYADVMQKTSLELYTKAGVDAGTTYTTGWASSLAQLKPLSDAFVAYARSKSLLGKLADKYRRVPVNVSVPAQIGAGAYAFVGQGAPKPAAGLQFQSVSMPILKAAGVIVVTDELMRLTQPASVVALRDELARGLATYLDVMLTDPTVAAVANVSPASITNAAPSVGSSGSSAANAATDIKKLLSQFTTTNPNSDSLALMMSPGMAVAAATATNATDLGPDGGTLFGVPTFTSSALGSRVIVLDPSALLVADDDGIQVSVSRQGTLEMDTSGASPQGASTALVSLWQAGLVGVKVDRYINWRMARANSVLYTNVAWV